MLAVYYVHLILSIYKYYRIAKNILPTKKRGKLKIGKKNCSQIFKEMCFGLLNINLRAERKKARHREIREVISLFFLWREIMPASNTSYPYDFPAKPKAWPENPWEGRMCRFFQHKFVKHPSSCLAH